MENFNILLNVFIILAMVFIATPNEADGFKILNYNEDFPAYQWPRVIYRERLPIIHKKDTTNSSDGQTEEGGQDTGDYKTRNELSLGEVTQNQTKRISDFYENIAQQKIYEKDSISKVIYGRVPMRVILVSSYPIPYQ